MARVSTYLNFPGNTEEAFLFYQSIFAGGKVTQALEVMFWGALYGACTDKFGVLWMFNCTEK